MIFINQKLKKTVVLIVMDGLGLAPPGPGNAVSLAKTPVLNKIYVNYPHGPLNASGSAVGLPHGTPGNSEVGHINIGAGQVVYQELPRIDRAITDTSFFQNSALIQAINHVKHNNSTLHLMGLASAGNVHSSIEHIFALLYLCQQQQLSQNQVLIHCFTDGRDTPPKSARIYIDQIEGECERRKVGRIASVSGRYFAMDRNNKWDRTKKVYDLLTLGKGKVAPSAEAAIKGAYENNQTDEFIEPTLIMGSGENPPIVRDNDAVIFFNYRPDRSRQLVSSFVLKDFSMFERSVVPKNILFVTLTEYEKGLPVLVAFPPQDIPMPFGRVISEHGMRQLRIAETEKYPHVTYFFDGGREEGFPGEDKILVPSPHVATYDLKPEMSAFEVTKVAVTKIKEKIWDFVLINYANPDMVGHTGNIPAAVKAVETVDTCVGEIIKNVLAIGGVVAVTADHGNCETMINFQTGEPDTNHTTNRVPFIFVSEKPERRELAIGILADIAPTLLTILGIEKPSSMTGRDLLA
jgi:2,3-bisphosphoglycerate-independent phosphoglycerate mutase|uniref:2,3-bisphosphoglycerate-independent phosphoglycerate mutase n=1 Tax=candidate division CPR3 bacterium TaxID=2268181 RepID=A0A7C5YW19_UNCC3